MDWAYRPESLEHGELVHRYGERVHILSDPFHLSMVASLSDDRTTQPRVNQLVRMLYQRMMGAVLAREFPTAEVTVDTRMIAHTPYGIYRGCALDPQTRVVCVDIARAGMLPAQTCFDLLNQVLEPEGVRQDHLVMNRVTDDDGQVTGARIFGEKTGGDVGGRYLLFPDPMGATGSSLCKAMSWYKETPGGKPARLVTMNLIVTPEFIRNVTRTHPDATVYAFRLDRGLSAPDVLETVPGTHWDREVGLNEQQYIVPGAGGLGEVINNVFV